MRLLLVHTLSLDTLGGAELSLRSHVETAPPGVEIDIIRPDDPADLNNYDTVVLSNLRPSGGLGEEAECHWAKQGIKRLKGYRGYAIRLEHDVHPCTYRDGRCFQGEFLQQAACGCKSPIRRTFERLYNLCDAIIFLSPMHRRVINQMIHIKVSRQIDIAPSVDFDRFRSVTPFKERKHAALITGDALRVAPNAVALAGAEGYPVEKVEYLSIPYEEMPELLNQYQAVVVAPVMLHAFGRLAVEAMACGCRVITNERVGAMSYPDPITASQDSNVAFWAVIADRPNRLNPRRFTGRHVWRQFSNHWKGGRVVENLIRAGKESPANGGFMCVGRIGSGI